MGLLDLQEQTTPFPQCQPHPWVLSLSPSPTFPGWQLLWCDHLYTLPPQMRLQPNMRTGLQPPRRSTSPVLNNFSHEPCFPEEGMVDSKVWLNSLLGKGAWPLCLGADLLSQEGPGYLILMMFRDVFPYISFWKLCFLELGVCCQPLPSIYHEVNRTTCDPTSQIFCIGYVDGPIATAITKSSPHPNKMWDPTIVFQPLLSHTQSLLWLLVDCLLQPLISHNHTGCLCTSSLPTDSSDFW